MALTIAIVLTICLGFASWHSARQAAAQGDWVEHTQSVRTKISSTIKDVIDMENGARGFALAGERNYLDPYDAGLAAIPKDLRELRTLTADSANQQKRLDVLDPQIRRAVDVAEQIVRERSLGRAIPPMLLLEIKTRVDEVRVEITAMDEEELRLLESRSRAMASARNVQVLITTVFSVLGLAFLAIGGVAIHRAIDEGALARSQVKALNSTLERRVEERTAELHQNEQRLQGFVESAMDAIITVDEDQNIVLFNSAAEKMFGCKCAHAVGRPLGTLIPERFRNAHPAHMHSFMESHATGRKMGDLGSVWGLRADGEEFPMEASISRTEVAGRRLLTAIARDITERKRTEEELRETNARTAFALETAKLGAWDLDLKTRRASRSLLHDQIFGYPSLLPEWSFDIFLRHVHPEDRRRVHETFESCTSQGKRWDFECRIFRADGDMRWIWACGDHLRESSVSSSAMFGVVGDITERKLAEAELREREGRIRALLDSTAEAILGEDLKGNCTFCNPAAVRLLGYEASTSLLGKNLHATMHHTRPDGTPLSIEDCQLHGAGQAGQASHGDNVLFWRKDGASFPAECWSHPLFDGEKLTGSVVTFFDISERNRAEAALRASEERFQAMVNGIPQLAWMAEPDGHIFWYNQRWYEYTGTRCEQMEGWEWQSVHDPVELPKVLERWNGAIASGKPFDMEFPLRGVDGRFRMFLTRVMPFKDSNGQVVRWFGTNTDISERKEVEERLKESERRYRTLFNEMVVAFALLEVIYDEEGRPYDFRYLAVNSAFESQSGQSSSVVGKTIREVLPDLDPFWFETYGRVATSGESVHIERHVQAITRWVDVTAFRASEGQVGVTFLDVTTRKEAELQIRKLNDELEERVLCRTSELESANKELEAFTYSVSHDLRAPLRHISGFSKLLSEEYGSELPAEAQHHVQRIQEGTRRMGQLVDDLLNLGRIGRQEIRLQVTDLKTVVKEVIEELQPECEGRQIEWRVGQLPFAHCDPGLVKQVFQNLIANAIKFTRPRTPAVIEVGQQEADGNQIIFVRDNGVGFSMKYCDKLFGVFQRLHRAEDFEGTGVGLATVLRIIKKHSGRIWAEAALDKGATFYFTIGVSENADRNAKAVVAGGKA